jgi:L-ascorbate 6-phosphate lactonase
MGNGTVKLRWLGQAGYLLEAEGQLLAIDPYCTDVIAHTGMARRYPSLIEKGGLEADAAIATHNHADHLDVETLRDYIGFRRFYGPGSCVAAMKKAGFPEEKLHTLDRGQTAREGAFQLTASFAEHTEDSISVLVECGGYRVYFSGDSRYNLKLLEARKLKPQLMFICINGKYGNMGWREATALAEQLGVKAAIPMHYDMFEVNSEDPLPFINAMNGFGIRSRELERGKTYELSELL